MRTLLFVTPYSGKSRAQMNEEFEVLNSRAETFFIESIPWGTGLDHLGQTSAAGKTHVKTLRKQIATIKEAIEGSKPIPKPPRGENRPRSPDVVVEVLLLRYSRGAPLCRLSSPPGGPSLTLQRLIRPPSRMW